MKKKLFFIATVFVSSFAFTACEEEVISPRNSTENTDNKEEGEEKEDDGQWD